MEKIVYIVLVWVLCSTVIRQLIDVENKLDTILNQTSRHAKEIEFINNNDTVFVYKNI